MSMLVVSVVALLTVVFGARGGEATAALRAGSAAGLSPYVRDGFEHGLGRPWNQTPGDRSKLFRLVCGYRSAKALALVVTPNSYGPVAGSEMTATSFHSDLAHAGWGTETTTETW
jgi:hypothetical protein